MPNQLEESSKHLRVEGPADLIETKLRRESADSGTSSSDAIIRVDSPIANPNPNSESDSGRPETPPIPPQSTMSTPQKQKASNPFGISGILAAQSPPKTKSVGGYKPTLTPSAFSNPSLHSAAVHHRNLQAAAVSNAMHLSTLMNLNNNIAAIQAAAAAGTSAASTSSVGHFASSTGHSNPLGHQFQNPALINPVFNPLLSQYHPLFQQRTNPLSKSGLEYRTFLLRCTLL